MNCQTCLEQLNQELDGGPAAEVNEHLRVCSSCRSMYGAAIRLRLALARTTRAEPPPGLSQSVPARVLADRRHRQRRRWLAAGVALAAALLLAIGTALFRPFTPPHAPEQARGEPQPIPRPVEAAVALRESVSDAGSAVMDLTSRTADETVGQTRLLLPAVAGPNLDDLEQALALEASAVSFREAGQGLSAGIEPITDSARRAVGLLLRDLSPGQDESKPGL